MIKSKSKIEFQLKKKTNPELVETILLAKKNSSWLDVASMLTRNRKDRKDANLSELEKIKGDIVVCGKVLSQGEIASKKRVIAFSFSKKAEEKLKKAGCEVILLKDEINKNKEAKGVTILK